MFRKTTVAAFAAITLMASAAEAHPKLLSSTPVANSTVAAPQHVEFQFSESLMAKFSGADLLMVDMPGMAMKTPMKMSATASVGSDGKTKWSVTNGDYVEVDKHRVPGKSQFKSPDNKQDLIVNWGDVQNRKVNLTIAPAKFQLAAPQGLKACGS